MWIIIRIPISPYICVSPRNIPVYMYTSPYMSYICTHPRRDALIGRLYKVLSRVKIIFFPRCVCIPVYHPRYVYPSPYICTHPRRDALIGRLYKMLSCVKIILFPIDRIVLYVITYSVKGPIVSDDVVVKPRQPTESRVNFP